MPGYGRIDRDYGIRLATTAPEDDGRALHDAPRDPFPR